MPDWTEHAVTIVALLAGLIALLGKLLWDVWMKREAAKESVVAAAIDRIGQEVSGLRIELKDMAKEMFARVGASEKDIAEIKARCEALHEQAQWCGWDRRQPTIQDFGFGSVDRGAEKK